MNLQLPPGKIWQQLASHFQTLSDVSLQDYFAAEPDRGQRLAIELGPLYLDYSKNHINQQTLDLLLELCNKCQLDQHIADLFSGSVINISEQRAARHTALRNPEYLTDTAFKQQLQTEKQRIIQLHEALANGQIAGFSNKAINTLVNIGIGGSDIGPRLVVSALRTTSDELAVHFISNLDSHDATKVLTAADPETTLFIVTSKSFTTLETRQNFQRAQEWLLAGGCPATALEQHFVAATARPQAALAAGINSDRIFSFDTSIGGRYSVWSTAGLTAMLAIGPQQFDEFLQGAAALDTHFINCDRGANMPVILALLDIWYHNFFNTAARAVVPYEQRLDDLPAYLTQLFMESNGKSVDRDGLPLNWQTGGIIFGGTGTTVQHSFFQSLHQGTTMIPVDFLVANRGNPEHAALFASCVAQARALMLGTTDSSLPPHQVCHGNRPSNLLLYEQLTPYVLGMLLALYEQRTFVQACLWNINPFDQWGVELGKQIAGELQGKLTGKQNMAGTDDNLGDDSSTRRLLQHYRYDNN